MKSFNIADYPYMVFVLVLFVLFAAGFVVSPNKQRRPMIISALLSTPCCFASVFFVPEYWNPVRIITFIVGIEDLLFSFSTGGIAWLLATWPLSKYIDLELRSKLIVRRYIICIVSGSAVNALFLIIGFGVMISAIFGILSVGIIILLLRRDLWPLQCLGMISFMVVYFIVVKGLLTILPEFSMQWNAENLCGFNVWGVPMEEIIWATASGAVWPLIMAYLFNVRLIPFRNRGRS